MNATTRRLARWSVPLLAVALLAGCGWMRRHQAKRAPYRKVSAPVAYELIRDNPSMLILDLRPPEEYNGETGHIRGAKNVPLELLPYRIGVEQLTPYREETFLVYCGTGDCGEQGMNLLVASRYEDAVLLDGGIDSWIHDGFKTVLPAPIVGGPRKPAEPVRPLRPGEKEAPPEVEITPPAAP